MRASAYGMSGQATTLDALGTLLRLEPPAPRLRLQLQRIGIEIDEQAAARAMRAEIAYYRANLHRGRDAESLEALRDDCARVARDALEVPAPLEQVRTALLAAIEFTPFDDAVPALERLRAQGHKLAVVSNWDVSLHEVLERTGLREHVDAVVSSVEVGSAKPDAAPFETALARLGVDTAVHVGDSAEEDVAGARAAGLTPVLIDRDGTAAAPDGVRVIGSLHDLP